MEQYPIHGNPRYDAENKTPYDSEVTSSSRGEPYITDLAGRSTLTSDNVEMVKRLKQFVPKASVKQCYATDLSENNLGYENSSEEENIGANYKAKYQ
jgi:hypothetical protein